MVSDYQAAFGNGFRATFANIGTRLFTTVFQLQVAPSSSKPSASGGKSPFGLATNGEVVHDEVSVVSADSGLNRLVSAGAFNLWAAAFVDEQSKVQMPSLGSEHQLEESIWDNVEPTPAEVIDLAFTGVASDERRPPRDTVDSSWLDEDLVDLAHGEDGDSLLQDEGFGGLT